MEGLITKSTGSWYQVQTKDGQKFDCRIKGIFRTKGITTTNPIAVGDVVDFEMATSCVADLLFTLTVPL